MTTEKYDRHVTAIKKYNQGRVPIINQKPFIFASWLTAIGVILYLCFAVYDLSAIEALLSSLPIILISSIVIGMSYTVFWDEENAILGYKAAIETPTRQHLIDSLKKSSQFERVVFYDPHFRLVVEPPSIRNLAHVLTDKLAAVTFIFFISLLVINIMMKPRPDGFNTLMSIQLISMLVFIGANFLIYAAINIFNLVRMSLNSNTAQYELIHTSYTEKTLENNIKKLDVQLGEKNEAESENETEGQGGVNILELLNHQCHEIARRINNLVASGYVDADMIEKEKDFVEYSINQFIPSRVKDIQDFLKGKSDLDLAKQAFYESGRDELEKAIYAMLDKSEKILEALYQIEGDIERMKLESLKSEIADKDWAGLNDSGAVLSYISPYFQEYHLLKFPNLESKVVADNIVKKTLPKLIEQEHEAQNEDDLKLIRGQINSTKDFVKSIAIDTEESKQRRNRIKQEEEQSPLYLDAPSTGNPIRNLALANQRYLEALDKNLPVE